MEICVDQVTAVEVAVCEREPTVLSTPSKGPMTPPEPIDRYLLPRRSWKFSNIHMCFLPRYDPFDPTVSPDNEPESLPACHTPPLQVFVMSSDLIYGCPQFIFTRFLLMTLQKLFLTAVHATSWAANTSSLNFSSWPRWPFAGWGPSAGLTNFWMHNNHVYFR